MLIVKFFILSLYLSLGIMLNEFNLFNLNLDDPVLDKNYSLNLNLDFQQQQQ